MEKINFAKFLVIILFIFEAPIFANAEDVKCWTLSDCDNPNCQKDGPSLLCEDNIPGCFPACKEIEAFCPLNSACKDLMGVNVQDCAYFPLFPSCGIWADKTEVEVGEYVTISWSSDANSGCTAWGDWGGDKGNSGSENIQLTETRQYNFGLTCTNFCSDGEESTDCSVVVNVIPCNCANYGKGWHDPDFWGGCDDCNLNSINNCPPCGQALAWCDGCYWHTDWYPFREETFGDPGDEGGHKCPGNPKICTPNSNWCEGNTAWHCSSNGCSKWSEDCGSSYWTMNIVV